MKVMLDEFVCVVRFVLNVEQPHASTIAASVRMSHFREDIRTQSPSRMVRGAASQSI
jgi:hypothetical protein